MEVIFKAKDGKMFNSAEECVQYEVELASKEKEWEAWGWNGKSTDITTNAIVVNLPTEKSVTQFLEKAKLDGDNIIKGIEEGNEGWFFYDEDSEQYVSIYPDVLTIFKSIPIL